VSRLPISPRSVLHDHRITHSDGLISRDARWSRHIGGRLYEFRAVGCVITAAPAVGSGDGYTHHLTLTED
jgi:hypothetical protein